MAQLSTESDEREKGLPDNGPIITGELRHNLRQNAVKWQMLRYAYKYLQMK